MPYNEIEREILAALRAVRDPSPWHREWADRMRAEMARRMEERERAERRQRLAAEVKP